MAGVTYPEAPFSFTHKSGKGYDATMLTIRGLDATEFYENGQAVFGELWDDLIANHMHVPADAAQGGGAPAPAANNAAPAANNGGGQPGDWRAKAPNCAHGQMTPRDWQAKSGPKAGQTQYTYFCPQPREANDKCKPIDAISGKAWGS